MVMDGSTKKVGELVAETTFGGMPTDPAFFNFGGYVNNFSVKKTMVPVKFPYLKDDDDTNRLQSTKTQKVSEVFAATINMKQVNWSILPYVLCAANSTTYAIGDTVYDLLMGVITGDQYEYVSGGAISKFECTIAEDNVIESVLEMMFAKHSGLSGSDYVTGAGTHASTPTGEALKFGDLSGVLYDAATTTANGMTINNIKFGCEYPLKAVKDVGSSNTSKIAAWARGQRNISVSLNATLDDTTVAPDILDGTGHTLVFAVGSKTFTFSNIMWDGDWDEKFDPEDIIAMPLSASNVDLAIA